MLRIFRGKMLLFLLAATLSVAPAQEKMPALSSGEIPSLEIVTTQHFAGKSLYGYIDGGADLYHEYGFDRVVTQEVRLKGEQYWVEVFRMSDPRAALGIFSVSRGNCGQADSLTRFSCSSSHAVQYALSNYFIRIANASGSPVAQAGGIQLARLLSAKIQGDPVEIPSILGAAGGAERNLLYVRGPLGMQNGFDDWSPLVDGLESFEAYIVVRPDSSMQSVVGDFRFGSDPDFQKFKSTVAGRGEVRKSLQKGDRRIIILESGAPADSLWSRLIKLP